MLTISQSSTNSFCSCLVGFLDGLGYLLHVEGLKGNKIHNLGIVALLLQLSHGLKWEVTQYVCYDQLPFIAEQETRCVMFSADLHDNVSHAAVREDNAIAAFPD